jgi:hypothetical protein
LPEDSAAGGLLLLGLLLSLLLDLVLSPRPLSAC